LVRDQWHEGSPNFGYPAKSCAYGDVLKRQQVQVGALFSRQDRHDTHALSAVMDPHIRSHPQTSTLMA
jgi:hypothetical protein